MVGMVNILGVKSIWLENPSLQLENLSFIFKGLNKNSQVFYTIYLLSQGICLFVKN